MIVHLPDIERVGRIDATGKVLVWTRCGQEVPTRQLSASVLPPASVDRCERCYFDTESVRILS